MKPVISIRNLNHYYGSSVLRKQVLFDINLDIQAGEIIIMTGPSGSGKTTLLTLLGGLRSVQNGSLACLGRELSGASESDLVAVRRHIGYIFQAHNLLPFMTAQQNVCMSLEMHRGVNRSIAEQQANRVLQQVGLGDRINYYPDKLSGGQKQRVAIARALASQPKLVLADEPTASLDKKTGRDVVDLMSQLVKQQGCTILLVTHDNRILDIADRIIHMEDGRLVSSSSPSTSVVAPVIETAKHDHKQPSQQQIEHPISAQNTQSAVDIRHSLQPPTIVTLESNNTQHRPEEQQDSQRDHSTIALPSTGISDTPLKIVETALPQYQNEQNYINENQIFSTNNALITDSQLTTVTVPQTNGQGVHPDIQSASITPSSQDSNSVSPKTKIYKVACIDDSSTVLRSVELFLDPNCFQTIPISDPVRALALILRHKPDLILLDIMMPHLDGYQLCSMLRKHHLFKKVPIVMATSRKGFIDKTKAKLCGASGYLVKQFNKVDLMSKIFQYLT